MNGATLMVAMVDWVIERRRALAALSAVGVPAGVIRRSILAQVVVPLATSVLFGVVGAITVIVLLFRVIETHVVVPAPQLAAWSAASIAVVLVVTAAAMPWVTATRRPELLRSE